MLGITPGFARNNRSFAMPLIKLSDRKDIAAYWGRMWKGTSLEASP
jgi:hypothetical protein